MEQITVQHTILKKYEEARGHNPSFSLRAFARKLELSSGALSAIINGKRQISKKMAIRLAHRLGLSSSELEQFLSTFSGHKKRNRPTLDIKYIQLQIEQYKIISSWEHFAILSLIKTHDFKPSVAWISERLGIAPKMAQDALDRLLLLGILVKDQDGNLLRISGNYTTSDEVASYYVRRAHKEYLQMAQECLDTIPVHQRDITAITTPVNPQKMALAKEMIRRFQDDLAECLGEGETSEVYNLCIQLYPLTVLQEAEKEVHQKEV